jgi:hypothetical protein
MQLMPPDTDANQSEVNADAEGNVKVASIKIEGLKTTNLK